MRSLSTNSFNVSGFMVEGLHLSGNELIVYAIIYGFTQDGEYHPVRISYLSRWINRSRPDVIRIIKSLVNKRLIEVKKQGRENLLRIIQKPIDDYAMLVEKESEKTKKQRGPSAWAKALEKARGENGANQVEDYPEKSERLKKIAEEARSYDPYADDEEES